MGELEKTNSEMQKSTDAPSSEGSTEIELKPLEYETRLLAYIDILGWTELIGKSVSQPKILQELNEALRHFQFQTKAREAAKEFFNRGGVDKRAGEMVVDVTHFSDLIVFSCPVKSIAAIGFLLNVQQTCYHLLSIGHYSRGAVVVGEVAHKGNVIFGPALVEAYKLERDVAKYPRIIIAPEAMSYLDLRYGSDESNKFYTKKRDIFSDSDGLNCVDILGAFADFQNEPRRRSGNEEQLREMVNSRLLRDSQDLGRVAKHTWMLKYISNVIRECDTGEIKSPTPY
jgi:hypothetical protein